MDERTRIAKVKGRVDAYVFVTLDLSKYKILHTSKIFSEADARQELKSQGLPEDEIESEMTHAKEHEI